MYYTYVVRPGEAPEGRGPLEEPFWEMLLHYSLRCGYVMQLFGYLSLLLLVLLGTERRFGLLEFYRVTTDSVGTTPLFAVMICLAIILKGVVSHVAFLVVSDDDSSIKQSRGFRAGLKFLAHATGLLLVSGIFTLISFYAANAFFSATWIEERVGTGAVWLVYYAGRCCEILGLLMYAGAIFFLETYHSEGAGELWGWMVGFFYTATAILEMVALSLTGCAGFDAADRAYTMCLTLALILGTAWAFFFEPISQRYDVRLTQSAMRAEYYKSKNAIAYYGPAVVNAEGELDVHASSQGTRGCTA